MSLRSTIPFLSLFFLLGLGGIDPALGSGLTFREVMKGAVDTGTLRLPLSLSLQAEIADIEAWDSGSRHPARLTGAARFEGRSIRIAGSLEMMAAPSGSEAPGRYLRYVLEDAAHPSEFSIHCSKHVRIGAPSLLKALTRCEGEAAVRGRTFPAAVKFSLTNPINLFRFLASFRVTQASTPLDAVATRAKFLKVYASGIWDSLFMGSEGQRPGTVFLPPDTGAGKTPYACSFHWFPLSDSRWLGLDIVRSDDTGKLALRAFVVEPGKPIRAFLKEAPASQWRPFATRERPDLGEARSVLGRGRNWIAGRLEEASGDEATAPLTFDLSLDPVEGFGWGRAPLEFLHLAAEDFTRVHVVGRVAIDGRTSNVDSFGITSIHYGDFLPQYAFVASLSDLQNDQRPRFLIAAVGADDIRSPASWFLSGWSLMYGYGGGGFPERILNVARWPRKKVPLGPGVSIELSDLQLYPHQLLGMKTVTGVGQATLVSRTLFHTKKESLGPVIVDFRGPSYSHLLE